ncbi:MAG: DUF4830 domain-containing protein [Ruminococcaceae bacterium]|nr:DUF4830 domain-containing protein [Oscillospiraceae bacterium]
MKSVLKGEKNRILLLVFLTLLFILWARVIVFEIRQGAKTQNLDTVLKRTACAKGFGWEVDPGSEKSEKIRIPEKFGDVYKNYNTLQKKCGFDLSPYRGKTVIKYTYIVLNPPENSKDMFYLNILIYDNEMIGGDVQTVALDGFMLPVVRGNDA